jgi:Kef-type K+ transport system membrane component KefB
MNPAAIESHLRLVLGQWVIIIACAYIFGRLGRRFLNQPLAVGEIFAGILLGPSFFGAFWPEYFQQIFPASAAQSMQLLGKLGLILLLFQVGMEFEFSHLRSRTRTVTAVAVTGLVVPMLGALLIGPWLHRTFAPEVSYFGFQLFICVAMAITALPIMGRILLEMKLEKHPLSALAISAGAIDDVVGWVLLAVITALATAGFYWGSLAKQVASLLVFYLVVVYGIGPALRWWWRRLQAGQTAQGPAIPTAYLAVLLMVLFACCITTNSLGVFSIFGAFLLGVSLHQEHALVKAWREKFSDFVLVALVPIFFTNTGLRTHIGSLDGLTAWLGCAVVVAVAVAGKLGGCFAGARMTGLPLRDSAFVATLMNTRALMGLVAINVGADLGLLPPQLFTMFVIMALVTTAMAGPLLHLWRPRPQDHPATAPVGAQGMAPKAAVNP